MKTSTLPPLSSGSSGARADPGETALKGLSLLSPPPEILAMEEEVAQSLLDAKERAHQGDVELQQLKAELQKAGEDNTRLKASLLYPSLCVRGQRISGLGARGPGPPTGWR